MVETLNGLPISQSNNKSLSTNVFALIDRLFSFCHSNVNMMSKSCHSTHSIPVNIY